MSPFGEHSGFVEFSRRSNRHLRVHESSTWIRVVSRRPGSGGTGLDLGGPLRCARAGRRLHDLPGAGRGVRVGEPPRPGPRARCRSTCAPTTCATTPPTSTGPSTTRPSAAAPAWCWRPSRSSAAVEAVDPPRPLLLLGPGRAPVRPGRRPRAGGGRRVLPAVRALRGRRPAGRRPPLRRRAVDRRLRARRRRGGGRRRARGRRAPRARA